jgi:hypothetical protein
MGSWSEYFCRRNSPASGFTGALFPGVTLSDSHNAETAGLISTDGSRVTLHVIQTDEDPMIARSVCGILETDAGNGRIDHENQHRYIGTAPQETRRDRR